MPRRVRMTALEVELGMALEDVYRFHEDWIFGERRDLGEILGEILGERYWAGQRAIFEGAWMARAERVAVQAHKALAFYHTVVEKDEEDTALLRKKIQDDADAERRGWR